MSDRSRPSGGRNPKRRPAGSGSGRPGGGRPGGGRPGGGRSGSGRQGSGRSDGDGSRRPPSDRASSDRRPPRDAPPQSGRSAKKEITAGTGQLPRWIRDEITHSTPKDRREAAILELEAGLSAFADEKYGKAAGALRKAKELAPRAATVREILGLSAYHLEQWDEALRELRTYRRLTGTTDHMAVEMDCQRALGKVDGIDKTWELFNEHGGSREAEDEIRVVYASSLLERGERERAWLVIKPGRLVPQPSESTLRRWAVAARVADANRDRDTARSLVLAIRDADPGLPWLSSYDDLLA
jgi:hypothetical protein